MMDGRSDAFLTLPGGIGTLEELLEIWVARSLGMHAKPVVVLDPTGGLRAVARAGDALVDAGFVRAEAAAELVWAGSLAEAFAVPCRRP
jgi:predicted Rossmann-fold nucleotide-binding protein